MCGMGGKIDDQLEETTAVQVKRAGASRITRNALSSDGPPLHLASASSASRPKPKASLAVGGEGEGAAPACEWGGEDLSSGGTEAGLRSGRVWSKNDWLSSSNLQ